MTIEEKHEYLVLAALMPVGKKLLSKDEYSDLTKAITGDSADYIRKRLVDRGYLDEAHNYVDQTISTHVVLRYGCHLTDMGIKAFHDLKRKRGVEKWEKIAFWVVVGATVITVYFTVIDHISCRGKPDKSQLPTGKDTSGQKPQPDTTAELPTTTDHPDTAN